MLCTCTLLLPGTIQREAMHQVHLPLVARSEFCSSSCCIQIDNKNERAPGSLLTLLANELLKMPGSSLWRKKRNTAVLSCRSFCYFSLDCSVCWWFFCPACFWFGVGNFFSLYLTDASKLYLSWSKLHCIYMLLHILWGFFAFPQSGLCDTWNLPLCLLQIKQILFHWHV